MVNIMKKTSAKNLIERPPVVAVMGHIDHGKSSLLDYIRKTNVVENEAGGITQHIGAYEVHHKTQDGREKKITFLDTPGHEAFSGIRSRGAGVADVAILVVSAEEGVKPQTLEALKFIKAKNVPFLVAITKIDKPESNPERTKQSMAESEIYVEGYGGDIPSVSVSARTGEGVDDLLEIVCLVADLAELKGDEKASATGAIIETHVDPRKGISATLIVKNGTIKQGQHAVSGHATAPIRLMEDFTGKKIKEATFSSPVKIIGWNSVPPVGAQFMTFDDKKEAEEHIRLLAPLKKSESSNASGEESEKPTFPIVAKADSFGSLEAIEGEIRKLQEGGLPVLVLGSGIGEISERDVRMSETRPNVLIFGLGCNPSAKAKSLAERSGAKIECFEIIYELIDRIRAEAKSRMPKEPTVEITGAARILKCFSKNKNKQIVGGRVESGSLSVGSHVRIWRAEEMAGEGKIRGLQKQKNTADEVKKGSEFGAMIESETDIAPQDRVEAVIIT